MSDDAGTSSQSDDCVSRRSRVNEEAGGAPPVQALTGMAGNRRVQKTWVWMNRLGGCRGGAGPDGYGGQQQLQRRPRSQPRRRAGGAPPEDHEGPPQVRILVEQFEDVLHLPRSSLCQRFPKRFLPCWGMVRGAMSPSACSVVPVTTHPPVMVPGMAASRGGCIVSLAPRTRRHPRK